MEALKPCPNPWCSSHRRDTLASKPFIYPNDHDGGPVRISCPVCPIEGPTEGTVDEAVAAWNRRALDANEARPMRVGDIVTQIALWADDEGLELSYGQGDDLARRIRSTITTSPVAEPTDAEVAIVAAAIHFCADDASAGDMARAAIAALRAGGRHD